MEASMWIEETFNRVLKELSGPILPSSHLYLPYLGTALLISMLAYFFFANADPAARPEKVKNGMFAYIFDRSIWLHRSARQDYWFFIVNGLIYYGIVTHFLVSSHVVQEAIGALLNWGFGVRETAVFQPTMTSKIAFTFLSVLAIDLTIYVTHLVQHKVAALWHFHSVHHSAEVLTVMTVSRQHPVDLCVQIGPQAACGRQLQQLVIGHRRPQEIRQSAGQAVLVDRRCVRQIGFIDRKLMAKHKPWRCQYGDEGRGDRLFHRDL